MIKRFSIRLVFPTHLRTGFACAGDTTKTRLISWMAAITSGVQFEVFSNQSIPRPRTEDRSRHPRGQVPGFGDRRAAHRPFPGGTGPGDGELPGPGPQHPGPEYPDRITSAPGFVPTHGVDRPGCALDLEGAGHLCAGQGRPQRPQGCSATPWP